jgi:hypothetical protein
MKYLILCLFALFLTAESQGQKWEIGAWAGTSHYFGDINTDFGIDYIHPAGGLIARENFTAHWSSKYVLSFGTVEAHDNLSKYPFQQERNLYFKSNILEASFMMEFHFFKYLTGNYKTMFTPYLTGGIGMLHFNPKLEGETNYDPDELEFYGTEGQGFVQDKYSLTTFTIPYGIGIKYWIGGFWNVGAEISKRKAMTDYLDDVSGIYVDKTLLESYNGIDAVNLSDRSTPSNPVGLLDKQRGNRLDNDDYLFIGVWITYTIRTVACPRPY